MDIKPNYKPIRNKRKLKKVIESVKKIPQKKHHLDFIAAILTIPVLISVIVINYGNLKKTNNNTVPIIPTQTEKQIIIIPDKESDNKNLTTPTNSICKKDIGNIEISFPKENDTIKDNPICFNIRYTDSNYCSVVWSYRVNGGNWSDFTSNNPCIYNSPNGNIKFELKVQSTVIQKEEIIIRNFNYQGESITPSASPSAN